MRYSILFFCCALGISVSFAQVKVPPLDMQLQPYRMVGQDNLFRRNLTFADYKTQHIRRTLGSFFSYRPFSIANAILQIDGIPLYKKDKLRAKDVFRFELMQRDTLVSITECRDILHKNETFRLLRKQDSSFFGARNVDFLEAWIQPKNDTASVWHMLASNLNGSKDENQKGIIRNDKQEISFIKTTLLLRDKPVSDDSYISLLASLNLIYAFTYNDEIVAAVSFKETDRQIWIKEGLDESTKNVIASAACVLTIRRELYE